MSLSLELIPYSTPLAQAIRTSTTVLSTRSGWRLKLSCSERGLSGWGELACWPGFGSGLERTRVGVERLLAEPEEALKPLRPLALSETSPMTEQTREALRFSCAQLGSLELAHGLELAALDLKARALDCPLGALLSQAGELASEAPSHALITDLQSAERALDEGYEALKLKVGARDHWSDDGLLIAELSSRLIDLGSSATLRLDANQAWSEAEAIGALVTAQAYGAEWVEEPLLGALTDTRAGAAAWGPWLELIERSGATLAADESLQRASAQEQLELPLIEARLRGALQAGVKVITLKPMFVGGLLSCARLARVALNEGARVCLTHSMEGALGRRGVAHLSAALIAEGHQIEGGLTGGLPRDIMSPLPVQGGRVQLSDEPGLGLIKEGWR